MLTCRYLTPLLAAVLVAQTACLSDYTDNEDNALLGLLIAASLTAGPFTAARVSRTSAQSVPGATTTALAFDQLDFDTNNLTDGEASGGLSTPADGTYLVSGGVDFNTNATGTRSLQFTAPTAVAGGQITDSGGPTAHSLGVLQTLAANTTVGAQTVQDSGAALDTMTDPSTHLALVRMDRAAVSSAFVRKTTLQAIPDAVLTSVTFDSADYDTAGYFNAAQPDRLTIPEAGVYLVVANSELEVAGVAGARGVELLVNGTTAIARDVRTTLAPSFGLHGVHALYSFAAGDTVALRYFQDSGAPRNLQTRTTLAIARLDASVSSARAVLQRRITSGLAVAVSNADTLIDMSVLEQTDAAYTIAGSNSTAINQSGLYLTIASLQFATNAISRRRIDLLVNGTRVVQVLRAAIASDNGTLNLMHMQRFNAGDTLQVRGNQSSGGSLTLQAEGSFLQMIKLD